MDIFNSNTPTRVCDEIKFQEENIISYQVIRVEKFSKGSLGKIGGETERTSRNHRNEDIDDTRTPLNYYYKKSDGGLSLQWKSIVETTNSSFKETKKSVAFEGMIITSDKSFFEKLGYVQGQPPPQKVIDFFNRSYQFVLRQIGYHDTDENILSAVVHLDETTPHLQLYYIPLVNTGKKKVYAKAPDGKVLRNKKGSPIQAKDSHGKSIYEEVKLPHPKVCSSDFWEQRGGQLSFGNLQDDFYEQVSIRYGLERGEIGSNKKHTTKYEWEKQRQEKEIQALQDKIKPMQEYLRAFQDAIDGKKPFSKAELRKQIVGLIASYKQLEKEKAIKDKDSDFLFSELRKLEKKIPELERYKEYVDFIHTHAPDKLLEAKRTANERARAPKPPKNKNYQWTK